MKAIILAGGFGTRLLSVTGSEIPKPMVPIIGKPFLEHQIRFLKENEITDIVLAVHHHADKIKTYFGNGLRWAVDITYSEEDYPLGTAGAIKNAERYIDNT
ncbi:MAG: sugar phosphate nucleotidyltransferase, partial [Nanoarchaeota archaeon]